MYICIACIPTQARCPWSLGQLLSTSHTAIVTHGNHASATIQQPTPEREAAGYHDLTPASHVVNCKGYVKVCGH